MRVIVSALLVLAPLAASAQEPAPAPAPAPVEPEKRLCRREPPPVGSILGNKTICHSKAEWQRIDADRAGTIRDFTTARDAMPGTAGRGN